LCDAGDREEVDRRTKERSTAVCLKSENELKLNYASLKKDQKLNSV
jgi:hypothetical protein